MKPLMMLMAAQHGENGHDGPSDGAESNREPIDEGGRPYEQQPGQYGNDDAHQTNNHGHSSQCGPEQGGVVATPGCYRIQRRSQRCRVI